MKSMPHPAQRRPQHGFTFLEVSIVLVIVALLTASVSYALTSTMQGQSRRQAVEHARTVQASIRAYVLRNGRLPCPAIDASGYENRAGQVCPPGLQVGFVPYVALGLQVPEQSLLGAYAVYRQPNSDPLLDTDLTEGRERTGDAPGDPNFTNANDLISALLQVGGGAVDPARPFITGDADAVGAMDCTANRISAVAYWVALPMLDADNNGNRFDGGNAINNLCASYPMAPVSPQFDDVVIAETPLELAGWLKSWMRP